VPSRAAVVARALAAYSPQRAAIAIWTQVRASSLGRTTAVAASSYAQSSTPQAQPWTSASRPDAGLDARDGRDATTGDVNDASGDLLGK
jgi:hypothetical protein